MGRELDKSGSKIQISSYKIKKEIRAVMCNIMTIINTAVRLCESC